MIFGAVAARSFGIYFLDDHADVLGDHLLLRRPGHRGLRLLGIGGIDRYTPGFVGDIVTDRNRLYYIALGTALVVYGLIRYVVRPFGVSLQGSGTSTCA